MYTCTQQLSTDNRTDGRYEASSAPVQHGCIDNGQPMQTRQQEGDTRSSNTQKERKKKPMTDDKISHFVHDKRHIYHIHVTA